jgi:hypothetical protein
MGMLTGDDKPDLAACEDLIVKRYIGLRRVLTIDTEVIFF